MMGRLFPKPDEDTRVRDRRASRRDVALLAPLTLLLSFLMPVPANSATAYDGITIILFGNDRWYNYDFLSESASAGNVDWPIGVLFINDATIDRTKTRMEQYTNLYDDNSTNSMHMRMSNYYDDAWGWDGDRGKKNPSCPAFGNAEHYRVYSTNNGGYERMYNQHLGYNVIASVHRDWNECGGSVGHGYSEASENRLLYAVDENTPVSHDRWGIYNDEPYRSQGNRIWQNNGKASTVTIYGPAGPPV